MSEDTRATLTGALWFCSALVLGALFISAAAQGALTLGHVVLACVILALVVTGTSFLLRRIESETPHTKVKRERLDKLLRNLSDEELAELKQRLSDVDLDEATSIDYLGDDGELVRRS
jgi:hypothetical protein